MARSQANDSSAAAPASATTTWPCTAVSAGRCRDRFNMAQVCCGRWARPPGAAQRVAILADGTEPGAARLDLRRAAGGEQPAVECAGGAGREARRPGGHRVAAAFRDRGGLHGGAADGRGGHAAVDAVRPRGAGVPAAGQRGGGGHLRRRRHRRAGIGARPLRLRPPRTPVRRASARQCSLSGAVQPEAGLSASPLDEAGQQARHVRDHRARARIVGAEHVRRRIDVHQDRRSESADRSRARRCARACTPGRERHPRSRSAGSAARPARRRTPGPEDRLRARPHDRRWSSRRARRPPRDGRRPSRPPPTPGPGTRRAAPHWRDAPRRPRPPPRWVPVIGHPGRREARSGRPPELAPHLKHDGARLAAGREVERIDSAGPELLGPTDRNHGLHESCGDGGLVERLQLKPSPGTAGRRPVTSRTGAESRRASASPVSAHADPGPRGSPRRPPDAPKRGRSRSP